MQGWQCPCCKAVMAPIMPVCMHCKPKETPLVPRHIVTALEAEVKHARESAAPGQRIVRGMFVLHYIEAVLEAVKK